MRRRNLFTGEKSYAQHRSLTYSESSTETRCAQERSYLSQRSTRLWLYCVSAAVLAAWASGTTGVLRGSVAIALLAATSYANGSLPKRAAWALADIWLAHLFSEGEDWTISDSFFALFPGVLSSKHYTDFYILGSWSQGLCALLAESAAITLFAPVSLVQFIVPLAIWTTVAAFLEKDQRDLWALGDSYKRSEQNFGMCFNGTVEAVFIARFDGAILYQNAGARHLSRYLQCPKAASILDLFQEENVSKVREALTTAAQRESDEKEILLKRLPTGALHSEELRGLGLLIRSKQILWKQEKVAMVMCEDVSLYIIRRLFLAGIYKQLHASVLVFSDELERLSIGHEKVDGSVLHGFHALCDNYGDAQLLQNYVLGRAELKREAFNARSEVEAVMELAVLRAAESKVDLQLTREDGFPSSVCGDKIKHEKLLSNIISFAISKAKPRSEVSLLCSVEGPVDDDIWLGYKLTFKPAALQKEDMDELLLSRKQDTRRRTMHEVIALSNKHGLGIIVFDALLLMMRGYVTSVSQNMLEMVISVKFQCVIDRLPLMRHPTEIRGTPLFVSQNREEVNGQTLKWKVSNTSLRPSSSAPNLIMKRINRDGAAARISPEKSRTSLMPVSSPLQIAESFSSLPDSEDEGEISALRQSDWSEVGISERGSLHNSREQSIAGDFHRFSTSSKVLVVDSNPYRRKELKAALGKLGCSEFDEARNDTEAMQMYRVLNLQRALYSVVFVDSEQSALANRIREVEEQHSVRRTFVCGIGDAAEMHSDLFDFVIPKVRTAAVLEHVLQRAGTLA